MKHRDRRAQTGNSAYSQFDRSLQSFVFSSTFGAVYLTPQLAPKNNSSVGRSYPYLGSPLVEGHELFGDQMLMAISVIARE
jgi:hypothetical protein